VDDDPPPEDEPDVLDVAPLDEEAPPDEDVVLVDVVVDEVDDALVLDVEDAPPDEDDELLDADMHVPLSHIPPVHDAPFARGPHVPSTVAPAATLHAWQSAVPPAHARLQQTPSVQKPVEQTAQFATRQLAPACGKHAAPCAFCASHVPSLAQ
jgi:hypothetical protein